MNSDEPTNTPSSPSSRKFTCPTCRRSFPFPDTGSIGPHNPFPFCSERCKLIDLGAWLDSKYRIPTDPDEDSKEGPADPSGDLGITP